MSAWFNVRLNRLPKRLAEDTLLQYTQLGSIIVTDRSTHTTQMNHALTSVSSRRLLLQSLDLASVLQEKVPQLLGFTQVM